MVLARVFVPEEFALQQPERAKPRSRALAVCALVLALLTGLTAGQLAALTPPDFGTQRVRPSGRAAFLASAYFDAVNAYLSGEDASQLQALIAPDYRGHSDDDDLGEGKDQLLTRLAWLAKAFPNLRVRSEVVSTNPDLAVVQVTIEGTSGGAYEAIPLEIQPNPSAVETLRFDGDLLAEQWSKTIWPGRYDVLGSAQSTITTGGVLQPRLERIELQAGGRLALGIGSAHLLFVESGTLTIQGAGGPGRTPAYMKDESNVHFASALPIPLSEGELALAAGFGPYQLENSGSGLATLLLFRITSGIRNWNQGYPVFPVAALSDSDISRVTVANGSEIESDSTSWQISIGRVTLTEGSSLAVHPIDGSETVVVESGELLVVATDCESRCVATEEGSSRYVSGEALLRGTQGFSASQNATVSYMPLGTAATVLIIKIVGTGAIQADL